MKVAYHFNADSVSSCYGRLIEKRFFEYLNNVADLNSLHLKIFHGDLLTFSVVSDKYKSKNRTIEIFNKAKAKKLKQSLAKPKYPVWRASFEKVINAIFKQNIYVIVVEGLAPKVRDALHQRLTKWFPYLGAQQIYEGDLLHWVLYSAFLIPAYRIINGEMRIFYFMDENDKNTGLKEYFENLGIFKRVTFEKLGSKYTIFDPYSSYEHAQKVAKLSYHLSSYMIQIIYEVLLRLEFMSPELSEMLYSMLERFQFHETKEDLNQAALTCRRILSAVADKLYPPTSKIINGHKLTEDNYRNRLCQYVKENFSRREKETILAEMNDIFSRIKKLDNLANKGVHKNISKSEIHRLITGLINLLYDLLSIKTLPHEHSTNYGEIIRFLEEEIFREEIEH